MSKSTVEEAPTHGKSDEAHAKVKKTVILHFNESNKKNRAKYSDSSPLMMHPIPTPKKPPKDKP